jgi:GTP-binding protein
MDMKITSAKFIKGVTGSDPVLDDGTPQVAFIGRSNAGKSSLLNSLTSSPKLAITSDTPGRTREINIFSINGTHYFIDLPGYGYAKASGATMNKISAMISWYLFSSEYTPTVVVLIDALVGPTKDDIGILHELEKSGKRIVVVANKVDKIPKSSYLSQLHKLQKQIPGHTIVPYSSKTKVGITELTDILITSN